MGAKRVPSPRMHSHPPATPPYSYQHSDSGDARYMHISMHSDSLKPKRVPTLQLKSIWMLKGCPAQPAFQASCHTTFQYQHSGPGDA